MTEKKAKKKNRIWAGIKTTMQVFVLLGLTSVLLVMGIFYFKYGKDILILQKEGTRLVRESDENIFKSAQTSLVYDSEGELISTIKSEKEVYYLEFKDIPKPIIDAMVVTEDRKFLEHGGVDYIANVRAALNLIKNKGKVKQGASTITQQLARNVFLSHQVSYERKVEEIFVAQELEKKYSKTKIMEFYLNNIYFANGYYGIQAASKGYFDREVKDLTLSEMAFLCAIPNNPTLYNPRTNVENTTTRRDRILIQMRELEKISNMEYQDAISQKIEIANKKPSKNNSVETYAYYSAIRALMETRGFQFRNTFNNQEDKENYSQHYKEVYDICQQDLFIKGYRIYTSIDMVKQESLQRTLDLALEDNQEVNEEGVYELQGASVCIDNKNGRVVAVVGSREQNIDGFTFNRAYQTYRQPGSAIKPLIVYAPAFEGEYTPGTIIKDEKFEGGPQNSDKKYRGNMTLKDGVARSTNTIAWKIFEDITPQVGLSYLKQMGFSKIVDEDYYPASSLGGFTIGVSPVEMAAAFATLSNNGYYRSPTCVVKITDSSGGEIYVNEDDATKIYQEKAAQMITECLVGVLDSEIGTGRHLSLDYVNCAGKTGTTDNKKDGWFVGYTPYYTTSVWVGYDLPKTLEDLSGSTYPGRIWRDFMNGIHNFSMDEEFVFYKWQEDLPVKAPEVEEPEVEEPEVEEPEVEEPEVEEPEVEEPEVEEPEVEEPEVEEPEVEEPEVEEPVVEEPSVEE